MPESRSGAKSGKPETVRKTGRPGAQGVGDIPDDLNKQCEGPWPCSYWLQNGCVRSAWWGNLMYAPEDSLEEGLKSAVQIRGLFLKGKGRWAARLLLCHSSCCSFKSSLPSCLEVAGVIGNPTLTAKPVCDPRLTDGAIEIMLVWETTSRKSQLSAW